jgi:hypothetical protein
MHMLSTDITLSITDQRGENVRGKVVYWQPKAERWREARATVHIICTAWLDSYTYLGSF